MTRCSTRGPVRRWDGIDKPHCGSRQEVPLLSPAPATAGEGMAKAWRGHGEGMDARVETTQEQLSDARVEATQEQLSDARVEATQERLPDARVEARQEQLPDARVGATPEPLPECRRKARRRLTDWSLIARARTSGGTTGAVARRAASAKRGVVSLLATTVLLAASCPRSYRPASRFAHAPACVWTSKGKVIGAPPAHESSAFASPMQGEALPQRTVNPTAPTHNRLPRNCSNTRERSLLRSTPGLAPAPPPESR